MLYINTITVLVLEEGFVGVIGNKIQTDPLPSNCF